MKHKILFKKLKENGWNMRFDAREQALIKDIAEITEKVSLPVEPEVMRLQDIADTLAMDCLQSTRYQTDPNFKKKVDDTLYLTRDWS